MALTSITSHEALTSLLSSTPSDKISIIDFWATWCGPCKAIAPYYEQLAGMYAQVQFLKVDVDGDQNSQIVEQYGITAMPTFVVLKGSQKIDQMKGANQAMLKALVQKHAGQPQAGGGGSGTGTEVLEGFASLQGSLDLQQVSCLNEDASHSFKDLLRNNSNGGGYLQSDADEQLLMHIPCQTALKIKALRFRSPKDQLALAPKSIKLFINSPTLGFDEASSGSPAPVQEVDLSESQALGEGVVMLKFVKFQAVNSLQIFVQGNQGGGDVTRIYGVELIGQSKEGADMKAFKKAEDE